MFVHLQVFFSIIMLSVLMVDLLLPFLLKHVYFCVHTCTHPLSQPTPPQAGILYYIFVEEKWDVVWPASNLTFKCSRHCPCYCSACLFMDVFVLRRWKKSLKFHAKCNLVKVCFHWRYLNDWKGKEGL